LEEPEIGLERHSVGATHGRSLGRSSGGIPIVPGLPPGLQQWVRSGIVRGLLEALAEDLPSQGRLDVCETFIDGSFAPAKKGDRKSAKQNVANEPRSWLSQTAMAS
jgi:hypothetical protein